MIAENTSLCPKCGGRLRYFDTVKRIVRTKARVTEWHDIRRLRCTVFGVLHLIFAKSTMTFMEVKFVETKKIISTIGTLVIVGAVSTAGAALWTNVLHDRFELVKAKNTHFDSDKVIVVDFKNARREASR